MDLWLLFNTLFDIGNNSKNFRFYHYKIKHKQLFELGYI